MRLCFIFLAVLVTDTIANELTRCCAGGTRHFKNSNTCSSIKSEGTSMTCQRAASICCLRSLLDSACDSGTDIAKEEESCPSNINILGGGLKKECCDCCLLAKDLLNRNEPCVAPAGFSAGCLRSFNKCCNGEFEITHASEIITGRPLNDPHVLHLGDRCSTSNCEHLCHDRGGEKVECSCRSGYDLAPDGMACIDRNECTIRPSPCASNEDCVNTIGAYICQRRITRLVPHRHRANRVGNAPRRMRDDPYSRAGEYREASQANTEFGCPMGWLYQHGHCVDVDECNLGSHDCGPLYQCRNTQGSYRCDPKKCGDGELQNPMTGECTSITCPNGYYPKSGMCNDIDECVTGHNCGAGEECVNTPGSFRCQQKGNLCAHGYEVNDATGFCEDVNECQQGVCGSMECINLPGTYKCKCGSGYEFNDAKKRCEDIDECSKFAGHVCDLSAECINTIGSFECKCKPGFQLASDGRRCEDVNECTTGIATCEQKCVNIPGSYQCICDRGFALGPDGTKCEDIDECSIWAGSGNDLCMGGCINTKGSYLCQCPPGYKIQPDGRTCVDVDECAMGECAGTDKVCVNTLGSFKCHSIDCPTNYVHDSLNKNRCNRIPSACGLPEECSKVPLFLTYQFISLARAVPISSHRPAITLFKVSAPNHADTEVAFELQLKTTIVDAPNVLPAIRANFLLQKGEKRNSAVVTLRDSLDGPQTVKLQLLLRMSKKGKSFNTQIADGYSCIKVCSTDDTECLGNHTREVLYQFRAVPSLKTLSTPIEVSKIVTHMGVPFSVDYSLDYVGKRHFKIVQDKNIGIVQLVKPIRGPTVETIKVNIHTKSRTGVILAFNEAVIEISVSKYSF
ncbi:hypothetical protein L3Y34_003599 [Caenorhabditis briggsae]|uniref:Fibulin-1 n=1 Tax=Caenorhabditis briggsae TaxID=6238 RepID=A0AAE9AFX1_CAEBR|nr:hypothetical protein L3Y34_003599 [Caenorhabditis briggsae]